MHRPLTTLLVLGALALLPLGAEGADPAGKSPVPDSRHLSNGWEIPGDRYCDQPYLVKTDDGAWLCAMTTAQGAEGSASQNILTTRSTDQGKTWSKPVFVEPAGGPEASYAVLLKVPGGRVYCFYNHNTDNTREIKREDTGVYTRVDSQGHYVFRYSDDGGRSWSAERYEIPIRAFEWDRKNVYGGKIRFFWNVGRPLVHKDAVLIPHHKVAAMGEGFFAQSEGAFLRSPNLLRERDPKRIRWETLPEGDVGLRTPEGGGRIAEEQSVTALSDGSLFCVYRTIDGYPTQSYSRDGGRTWTKPKYLSYAPEGRLVKHPRAANFAWRCSNGKFLYWFHNHGGNVARKTLGWDPYADRNPAWVCAGEERNSPMGKVVYWSQPEILLYDDDPMIRMSYPDLLEDGGKYFVTETQKNVGRVHVIDQTLLDGLFGQFQNHTSATTGMVLSLPTNGTGMPAQAPAPKLKPFTERDNSRPDHGTKDNRAGFSMDLWLQVERPDAGQLLVDTRTPAGKGLSLSTAAGGAVRLTLNDGRTESSWISDRGTVSPGKLHHVVATVDGGPKIITFVIDGVLCDGGDELQFGWGRYNPMLRDANGADTVRIDHSVQRLRFYNRPLRTSEAVGNYRAGEK